MEELLSQLIAKTGISEEQANQVIEFLKEHVDQLPALLGQEGGGLVKALADKLPGGLGDMISGGGD